MISKKSSLDNLSGIVPEWLINLEKERLKKLVDEKKIHQKQRREAKIVSRKKQRKREEGLDLIKPIIIFLFINNLIAIIIGIIFLLFG